MISFYITCYKIGGKLLNKEDPKIDFLNPIATDWTTVPFVEIDVVDSWSCDPETQSEVFTRPWYGLYQACDCLDMCATNPSGYNQDWCYKMVQY